jgi:hypothetical protein
MVAEIRQECYNSATHYIKFTSRNFNLPLAQPTCPETHYQTIVLFKRRRCCERTHAASTCLTVRSFPTPGPPDRPPSAPEGFLDTIAMYQQPPPFQGTPWVIPSLERTVYISSRRDAMPVTPTYPGVYIEEIPGGVRTITGVATSITAFVGRAQRGPVNEQLRRL